MSERRNQTVEASHSNGAFRCAFPLAPITGAGRSEATSAVEFEEHNINEKEPMSHIDTLRNAKNDDAQIILVSDDNRASPYKATAEDDELILDIYPAGGGRRLKVADIKAVLERESCSRLVIEMSESTDDRYEVCHVVEVGAEVEIHVKGDETLHATMDYLEREDHIQPWWDRVAANSPERALVAFWSYAVYGLYELQAFQDPTAFEDLLSDGFYQMGGILNDIVALREENKQLREQLERQKSE